MSNLKGFAPRSGMRRFQNTHPYGTGGFTRQPAQSCDRSRFDATLKSTGRGAGRGLPRKLQSTGTVHSHDWHLHCQKLITAMMELEESKPVCQPIDRHKYPEFYCMEPKPTDLSTILGLFQRGYYKSPKGFAADIRHMFTGYQKFFNEPNSQIYSQLHKLSWWFEAEYQKISESVSASKSTSILPRVTTSSNMPLNGVMSQRSLTRPSEPHRSCATSSHSSHSLPASSQQDLVRVGMPSVSTTAASATACTTASVSAAGGTATDRTAAAAAASAVSGGAMMEGRNSTDATSQDRRVSTSGAVSTTTNPFLPSPSGNTPASKSSKASKRKKRQRRTRTNEDSCAASSLSTPSSSAALVSIALQFEVSNIWFGKARVKPVRPVTLTENGLDIPLKEDGEESVLTVHRDEMVKCAAHLSCASPQRHTFFLFVLPNCTRRLVATLGSAGQSGAGLLALFARALDISQLGLLMHIFWRMGRSSPLGPVFVEIGQQGALSLLANIKPDIVRKVNERVRDLSAPMTAAGDDAKLTSVDGDAEVDDAEAGVSSSSVTTQLSTATTITRTTAVSTASSDVATTSATTTSIYVATTCTPVTTTNANFTATPNTNVTTTTSSTNNKDVLRGAVLPPDNGTNLQSALKLHEVARMLSMLNSSNVTIPAAHRANSVQCDLSIGAVTDLSTKRSVDNEQDIIDCNGDLDLEIIDLVPSDDDTVCPSSQNQEGGDDLVMTVEKISIRCPITQMVMEQPVKNRLCGHIYDGKGVENLIRHRGDKARCPVPGCSNVAPLALTDLLYDEKLLKQIQCKK